MNLEFLSVSALFQPHTLFDFLIHSFSQQASFGVTDFCRLSKCPFINDPVDEGAALLRRDLNIRQEIVIRLRVDVLAFPDNYLFERYRFTSRSIIYIHNLIRLYIKHYQTTITHIPSDIVCCAAVLCKWKFFV